MSQWSQWFQWSERFVLIGILSCSGCVATAPTEDLESENPTPWGEGIDAAPQANGEWSGYAEYGPEALRCARNVRPQLATPVNPSEDPATGELRVQQGHRLLALPLTEVAFDTIVRGTVADTEVRQVFENPFDEPIEAVYVFPLPHDAAVDDYAIEVGDRTITGVMKTRADARKTYETARTAGRRAGLLEQERPNIFTQSIANIPPGESVTVVMHMVGPVAHEPGHFELALPTIVGPRFIPGTPIGRSGRGTSPDTDTVPDASRITPPALPAGSVSCARLSVTVEVDAGAPVDVLASKHHAIERSGKGSRRFVTLSKDGELLNRDFVLGWSLATEAPQTSLMLAPKGEDRYFQLTIMPPRQSFAGTPAPRELVFVLDTSGSMYGQAIATAKASMRAFMANLGPDDAFQVIRFSERASALSPTPLPNTPENVARALEYIDALEGDGGTMMIEGIRAALDDSPSDGRIRYVALLTDGYIGNETEIFNEVDRHLGDARLFALGVGDSVNRFLLDGLARHGRGAVTYTGQHEAPQASVHAFHRRLAHPVLTDLEIDWGGLIVEDVVPARIPDLFTGQPVVVYGKLRGATSRSATLFGRAGGSEIAIPIRIEATDARRVDGLASMWARRKIQALEDSRIADPSRGPDVEAQVTALALEFDVMTKYTSFVAVDDSDVIESDGPPMRVDVPVTGAASKVRKRKINLGEDNDALTGRLSYAFEDDPLDGDVPGRRFTDVSITAGQRELKPPLRPKTQPSGRAYGTIQRKFYRLAKRYRRSVTRCFDDAGASGSVALVVVIAPDGSLDVVGVQPDDALRTCLETTIEGWKLRHGGAGSVRLRVALAAGR
jgi:Ca-activated chloride channel family protein